MASMDATPSIPRQEAQPENASTDSVKTVGSAKTVRSHSPEHKAKIAAAMRGNRNAQKIATATDSASGITAPVQAKPNLANSQAPRSNKGRETPQVVKTKVLAAHLNGESNSQIARDLDLSRPTVRKIIDQSEVASVVKEYQDRVVTELVPKAFTAVESDLDKKNGRIGLGVLNGTKVLNPGPAVGTQVNVFANSWIAMRQAREQERVDLKAPAALALAAAVPLPESTDN